MESLEEFLKSYSVYDLRELARNVGVKSPTNKKKEELIDAIVKITNKQVAPEFNSNKVGRPPIKNDHSNAFMPYSTLPNPQSIYVLQSSLKGTYGLPSKDDKNAFDAEGVLEITNYGYGMIRTTYPADKFIYISKVMISEHKLKIGDHVLGKVKLSTDNESLVMIAVTKSYNYELGYIREWFRDFIPCYREKSLDIAKLGKINIGNNGFIKCTDKQKQVQIAKEIYNKLGVSNIPTVLINFNSLEPSQVKLSTDIDINFCEKNETKVRAVGLAIEHAKRLVENKQDVVLVFSGLSEYLRILDNINKNQVGGTVMVQSVDKIKEIAGLSKSFKDCSLTSIFVDALQVPERYAEVMQYDIISNMHVYKEE